MSEKKQKNNIPIISNDYVKCYYDYLSINLYYFPYGSKKIRYSDIRSCELRSMDEMSIFDYKLWGMALTPVWWHCDWKRLGRKYYILLDINQWIQVGLTMDDNQITDVCNFIRRKLFSDQSNDFNQPPPPPPSYESLQQQNKI